MPLAYSFLGRRVKKLLCFYTQWDRNAEKCGSIAIIYVSQSNICIGVKQALVTNLWHILQILLHSSLIFAIFYRISILLTVIVYSRAGH